MKTLDKLNNIAYSLSWLLISTLFIAALLHFDTSLASSVEIQNFYTVLGLKFGFVALAMVYWKQRFSNAQPKHPGTNDSNTCLHN